MFEDWNLKFPVSLQVERKIRRSRESMLELVLNVNKPLSQLNTKFAAVKLTPGNSISVKEG